MAAVIDIRTGNLIPEDQPVVPRLTLIDGRGRAAQPRRAAQARRAAQPRRASRSRQARIYLVRRLAVALVVLGLGWGLVAALGVGVGVLLERSSIDTADVGLHVVSPDETLWSIAKEAQPGRDPRHTIEAIVSLNSDGSSVFDPFAPLSVGEEIRVPVG